jgi:5-formyltetrahydrofolate cyclo-ligase
MNKEELRQKYKDKRLALTAAQKSKLEDLILIQFQQLDIEIPSQIMTYATIEKMNEFDPLLITDYCYFKNPGQVLFYPVVNKKTNNINCVIVNDDTLFELNSFGIPEPVNAVPMVPEEIDLVIVPLLAYDVKGHRVGYGKGYYDRFLKKCKDDVIKIGFSFFDPEPNIAGINRSDVKLDYCISPERIYSF